MIRLGKPVQLFEWGEGTNTMNQRWDKIADGVLLNKKDPWTKKVVDWLLLRRTCRDATKVTLVFEVDGPFTKKNTKEDTIKVCQQCEGMTPLKSVHQWGEVAVGTLLSAQPSGSGKTKVCVEVKNATKIGY